MDCKENKHVLRDNDFGITWCIRCSRLMTKSSNKPLTKEDIKRYDLFTKPKNVDVFTTFNETMGALLFVLLFVILYNLILMT